MKKTVSILTIISLFVWMAPVFAAPTLQAGRMEPSKFKVEISVPSEAVQNSEAIVPLGSAFDKKSGKMVDGYAIIHYKDKTNQSRVSKGAGTKTLQCYAFLAKGARWRTTEPYVVVSDINSAAVARDLETWDSRVAFEVFGNQDTASIVDGADTLTPDNKNEIMWGDISTPGAIAVAIVWGIFYGPPQTKELVEYDVVFDNVDYVWGDATINPSVMDFENIATHELGHGAGMADLYQGGCSEETMYGYASNGEIKKRDLNAGDIAGIKTLYQ